MTSDAAARLRNPQRIPRVSGPTNIMTVDVEGWLESSLELFPEDSPLRAASSAPGPRVAANTIRLLEIFDEAGVEATFFVLGTVAESLPSVVKRIIECGHEVASHGQRHDLVYKMRKSEFRESLRACSAVLEALTGDRIRGYRAPYASITSQSRWALDVLQELGFEYDSSIFPISRRLYGLPGAKTYPHVIREGPSPLVELPFSVVRFLRWNLPVAGGGYFRLLPYVFTRWALRRVNAQGRPVVFYLHPYELDSDELRHPLPGEGPKTLMVRRTQRVNRNRTEAKLRRVLTDFRWTSARAWMADANVGLYSRS